MKNYLSPKCYSKRNDQKEDYTSSNAAAKEFKAGFKSFFMGNPVNALTALNPKNIAIYTR